MRPSRSPTSGASASRPAGARRFGDSPSFSPPVPSSPNEVVQRELGVSASTAYAAIDALAEAGVLVPRSANKRNRVWDAVEVLAALDEFADEARWG